MVRIIIGENEAGQRVDRYLRKYLKEAPLSHIYRIIRKDLKVNGRRVRQETLLAPGDQMDLYLNQDQIDAFRRPAGSKPSARRQFRIAYEDDQVLIVSKPGGLLVHGDSHEKKNTLVNQVCGYLQEKGEYDPASSGTFAPAPVNRIDRNTSGLVIFGKTAAAVRQLAECIRQRQSIRKFYLAIAAGRIEETLTLTDSLVKDRESNQVRVQAGDAGADDRQKGVWSARTRIRPLGVGDRFSLVEAELITGRTHQIRVHLAGAGHPLAGDPKYGDPGNNRICASFGGKGQLLHAWRLRFGKMDQPLQGLSGKTIEAQPPKAFVRAAEELIDGGLQSIQQR